MFGYVRPSDGHLTAEDKSRFQAAYCGLCRSLGRRYGLAARMILNYDLAFLAMLLSREPECPTAHCRCPAHPIRGCDALERQDAFDTAADLSVILTWWQLKDGVADHGFFRGLPYRAALLLLRRAYRKARARRPGFDACTQAHLEELARLEAEQCPSIDRAADAFAALLAGASEEEADPVRRRVLEQMLYHLGRWVYLIDAADDLQKDAVSGNYNPVALRYGLRDGKWYEENRRAFARTLDHSIHMIATAFELWDFGVWRPLLESTVYTGLFAVGRAVLEGTFHKMPPREQRKKHKKAEETT